VPTRAVNLDKALQDVAQAMQLRADTCRRMAERYPSGVPPTEYLAEAEELDRLAELLSRLRLELAAPRAAKRRRRASTGRRRRSTAGEPDTETMTGVLMVEDETGAWSVQLATERHEVRRYRDRFTAEKHARELAARGGGWVRIVSRSPQEGLKPTAED